MSDYTKLQQQGRGTSEMIVRKPSELAVTKWQDNKTVLIASSVHGEEPQDSCMWWLVKEKCHVTVPTPAVVAENNKNMDRIDLCNCLIGFYLMSSRTRWTIHTVQHFFDLITTNSWIEYRSDHQLQRWRGYSILTSSCCWLRKWLHMLTKWPEMMMKWALMMKSTSQ